MWSMKLAAGLELRAQVRVDVATQRVVVAHPRVVVAVGVRAVRVAAVQDERRVLVGEVVNPEAEVNIAPERYCGRPVEVVVRWDTRRLRIETQRAVRWHPVQL